MAEGTFLERDGEPEQAIILPFDNNPVLHTQLLDGRVLWDVGADFHKSGEGLGDVLASSAVEAISRSKPETRTGLQEYKDEPYQDVAIRIAYQSLDYSSVAEKCVIEGTKTIKENKDIKYGGADGEWIILWLERRFMDGVSKGINTTIDLNLDILSKMEKEDKDA